MDTPIDETFTLHPDRSYHLYAGTWDRNITPLMYIIRNHSQFNNDKIKEYICLNKDQVNKGSHNNYTPLMIAVIHNHEKIVKLLLDAGADVNQQNNFYKNTALNELLLIHDYFYPMKHIIKLLLNAGANPNIKNKHNFTSLMLLSHKNCIKTDIMEWFIEAGADPNLDDEIGLSSLHREVRYKNINNLTLLLNHGANINKCTDANETVLFFVQQADYPPENIELLDTVVKFLLDNGCDISIQNIHKQTALMYYLYHNGHPHNYNKVIDILVSATVIFNKSELKFLVMYGSNDNLNNYYHKFKTFCNIELLLDCIKDIDENSTDNASKNKQSLLFYLTSSYYEIIGYDEKLVTLL